MDRVVYRKNILEEVKCQIRFPAILAIEASTPVNFQEAVRPWLPHFEIGMAVTLPSGVPQNIVRVVQGGLSAVGGKSFVFSSEDRLLTLSLNKDNLVLTNRRYERWEPFREQFQKALETVAHFYRPSFYTHTCVRYKNSIRREQLSLESVPWSSLLQPWVSGPLSVPETAEEVEAMQNRCVIQLPDNMGRVEAGFAMGVHQPSNQRAFIIETHLSNDSRKEQTDVLPCLDKLHTQAGLFFRWCIKDDLHRAMRPDFV